MCDVRNKMKHCREGWVSLKHELGYARGGGEGEEVPQGSTEF